MKHILATLFTLFIGVTFLAGCSGPKDYDKKIVGKWVIYSLDGDTNIYKAFVDTAMTFKSDGSFSRGDEEKMSLEGRYNIKGDVINLEWNWGDSDIKKHHNSIISIKDNKLTFERDVGFTLGGKPRKSVYKKK